MASEWVTILIYGILTGLAFLLLPRILLCMCGFTCCGVRKSSPASHWHSNLGHVEGGSSFAYLQSTGAGGTPCGTKMGLFLFGCYLTVMLILMRDFSYMLTEAALSNSTTVAPTNFTGSTTSSDFELFNMTRVA